MSDITLTFGSNPGNPTSQLTFDSPFKFVDEDATTVVVNLSGAKFPAENFSTLIFPAFLSSSQPELSISRDDDHQITITINKKPKHYLSPWALSFNVNINPSGEPVVMASPNLFLVRGAAAQSELTVPLSYNNTNGNFNLGSAIDLKNLLVMINPSLPFNLKFSLDTASKALTFGNPPIIFDGGTPPDGFVPALISDTVAQISIGSDTNTPPAKLGAFRFVINVPTSGASITLPSPDPIIVNATIGDGTGT